MLFSIMHTLQHLFVLFATLLSIYLVDALLHNISWVDVDDKLLRMHQNSSGLERRNQRTDICEFIETLVGR